MHDETSDPAAKKLRDGSQHDVIVGAHHRRRRRGRQDWRLGGRAVSRWDATLLAIALLGAAAASLARLATARFAGSWGEMLASPVLWSVLLSVFAFAVSRSRPAGLFRFRPQDLLWGLFLGVALHLLQAALSDVNSLPFPNSHLIGESAPVAWLVGEAIPLGFMGPITEELFFRAVILVSVYQTLRHATGAVAAGLAAALASTALFILFHAVFAAVDLTDGLQYGALAFVCAAIVLLTGRLWGAILTHIVYNSTYLVLVALGSLLGR